MNDIEKNQYKLDEITPEIILKKYPVLLNYDFFSLAGGGHYGYFLDARGNAYFYHNPRKWNYFKSEEKNSETVFWGHEKDGTISREKLIQNLNGTENRLYDLPLFDFRWEEMSEYIISSEYEIFNGGCDMGIQSHSLLIFDKESDLFKRIILSTKGDVSMKSNSWFADEMLKFFHPKCATYAWNLANNF